MIIWLNTDKVSQKIEQYLYETGKYAQVILPLR